MLSLICAENRTLIDVLIERVGSALKTQESTLYIIVPGQLTLLTERTLLNGLNLRGSFRLRVMTPARLCSLIFEAVCVPMKRAAAAA